MPGGVPPPAGDRRHQQLRRPLRQLTHLQSSGREASQVIGKTSAKAEEPVERVMDSNCLLATLYRRFGVDTSRTFADNSGRPIAILPSGTPIKELF